MADYTKLPPGWDCKYETTTGNCYYINYFTKAMQLEDPRIRYKQLQNERCSTESIPMQPLHGSPYHVYPTSSFPAVKAFQGPNTNASLQSISASPLLSTRSQMEMSPVIGRQHLQLHGSPQTPRMGSLSRRSTIQETSFSNQIDTDAVVAKIQNMFPTAEENHIRLLLKKYYNREAVVISALQVEKHPVTMPGPFVTPPAQRHLFHSNSAFQVTPPARRLDITARTSRTGSPVPGGRFGGVISVHSGMFGGSPRIGEQMRSSPKPHSSPKMKLRYMKNIFPKADETLLLDILANSDNNVQKASEKLLTMGYVKRDFAAPKLSNRQEEEKMREQKAAEDKIIPLRPKEYTAEEKEKMKCRLQEKYTAIAERIILMALESVNYSEDRAVQILQIVQEEDESRKKKESNNTAVECSAQNATKSGQPSTIDEGNSPRGSTEEDADVLNKNDFKSIIGRISVSGHNSELAKGPDDSLLLADYVTWNGANPELTATHKKGHAVGPDSSILTERSYLAQGRNKDICKGPKSGLAKGSIYSQLSSGVSSTVANIKCN